MEGDLSDAKIESIDSIAKRLIESAKDVSLEYSLGKKVERGSTCVLYSITRLTRRDIAEQLIAKGLPKNSVKSFLIEEVKAGIKLASKYAPKLHDIVQDQFNFYLVFDRIFGRNGYDYLELKDHELDMFESCAISMQLIDIIAHCHSIGIAHRDIKPENFMISESDSNTIIKVKMIDFGYCKNFDPNKTDDDFEDKVFCGTMDYTSPQALKSMGHKTTLADIYSLGIVIHILFGGGLMFTLEERERYYLSTSMYHPDPLVSHNIPKQLRALILSMVSFDEADRPNASEVQAQFRKIVPTLTNGKTKKPEDKGSSKLQPKKSLSLDLSRCSLNDPRVEGITLRVIPKIKPEPKDPIREAENQEGNENKPEEPGSKSICFVE